MPNACSDIEKLVPTFLDDELAAADLREFESHIADCEGCRSGLDRAEREHQALRKHLIPPSAPDLLHKKIALVLDEEDETERQRHWRRLWAWSLPAVASMAAACALGLFVWSELALEPVVANGNTNAITQDAARKHFVETPMVVSSDRGRVARSAEEFLRTPVRLPRFSDNGVSLVGWEPGRIDGREAATFVYDLVQHPSGRHRVNVHALDARNLDLGSQQRRIVDGRELWIDRALGLSTVTYKSSGDVAYVFTSDMSDEALIHLVTQTDILLMLDDAPRR